MKSCLLGSTDETLALCYSMGLTPSTAGMVEDVAVITTVAGHEYRFLTIDGDIVARRFVTRNAVH